MTRPPFLFRRSPAEGLDLTGKDRASFLQGLCTNDVKALSPGSFLWAAALSPVGKVLFPFRVARREDRLSLFLSGSMAAGAAAHFRKYAVFQDARVAEWPAMMRFDFFGGLPSDPAPEGAELWPAFFEVAGTWTTSAASADAIERSLSTLARPIEPEEAEALRIEAGRPEPGREIDATRTPDEAGLSEAISTTKGCYVGQEIVARLRTSGRLPRRLVRLRFDGAETPPLPSELHRSGDPSSSAGWVTSAALSVRTGAVVGLGFAARDVEDGATVEIRSAPHLRATIERIERR